MTLAASARRKKQTCLSLNAPLGSALSTTATSELSSSFLHVVERSNCLFLFFVANKFSHSPRCPPSPFLIAYVFSLPLFFFFCSLSVSQALYKACLGWCSWFSGSSSLPQVSCQSVEGLSESGLTGNISLEPFPA